MSDIQWGNLGEWVSGLGALSAVAVALWSVRRTSTERATERRLRYGQAMSCWIDFPHSPAIGQAHVLNSGLEPITDWNLHVCNQPGCGAPDDSHVHGWKLRMSNLDRGMLAPNRSTASQVPAGWIDQSEPLPATKVEWRDPEGRLWHRIGGRNSELLNPEG